MEYPLSGGESGSLSAQRGVGNGMEITNDGIFVDGQKNRAENATPTADL